jgi:polysaccharide deacetylase family protein (PEP-CTERM system associated)
MNPSPRVANAITVDVEDYFQVEAFAAIVDRADWDSLAPRVADNTARLLDQFAQAGVHGTFFTLGWVAERNPALVARIVADGHELASHGYFHQRVSTLDEAGFRADVTRAKSILEDAGGATVAGYRAPTFSIGPRTPWAYDVLAQTGHRYSSSIYPVAHDLYGAPDAPREPFQPGPAHFTELPMSTVRVMGRNLPCSGGGMFRLLPYAVFRQGLRAVNRAGRPGMFYTHPWEFDPGQPRFAAASRLSRFRHYLNLGATKGRMNALLGDFAWDRVDRVFAKFITPA